MLLLAGKFLPDQQKEKLMSEEERHLLIGYLSRNPKEGAILQGTGGIRKIRWNRKGQGKSGGYRIIYYFHDESMPLFILTIFGKNEKDNLSQGERNSLSKLTKTIVKTYKGKDE